MVNLKKVGLLLFIALFSSCQDYYGIIDGGGLRSKRKNKWYINNRVNPESIGIDTDIIYKKNHSYKNGVFRF